MADITITHENSGTKGRYVAHVAGSSKTGEMTYSRASDALIIVDHTDVPDSLRGKKVGAALAQRVVADARASATKIIPLCPFFKSQALRHPDWLDVVKL